MQKKYPIILLTATIRPKLYDFVGRYNHVEREKDYCNAVEFYMKLGFPLVFVDNSNFRSDKILELVKNYSDFEYHSFESKNSVKGKGHGEKEIIDYALANSKLLGQTEFIFKISGRYIIQNISQLIKKINLQEAEVFVNYTRNLTWADTRIVIVKKSFYYQYFEPAINQYLDEKNNILLEHAFARSAHKFQSEGGKISFWPVYPFYYAHDGSNGELVHFNLYKKIKYRLYFMLKGKVFFHRA